VTTLLVLRAEPANADTAARAAAAGFAVVTAPIFTLAPIAWVPPDPAGHDAVMLTSANAARFAGPGLARFTHLPTYVVGAATAAAATGVGCGDVRVGSGDAVALVERIAADAIARPLHLCGREHRALPDPPMPITRRIVYAADPVAQLPPAAHHALAEGAIALVHSQRAAVMFAALLAGAEVDRGAVRIAAISTAAADDWPGAVIAEKPTDDALLAAAARLCDKG
jgi:uroporphyrinogen-III synthase